ncbi:MAG: aspartate kinase [Planctomycetota bacterium]|nr:MAG: aspartate kinase [Planctomycetota bacterium]
MSDTTITPPLNPDLVVAKFGGTSVANAAQLRKVQNIIEADARRRVIVPSAPGKEHSKDTKVTDLLYLTHELAANQQSIDGVWSNIEKRFWGIVTDLGIRCDLQPHLDAARDAIVAGADAQFAASRGEALNGRIVACLLDAEYIDAAEVIRFTNNKRLDSETYTLLAQRIGGNGRYVLPGFYGANAHGEVQTFSRGGSDVSGAIAAAALCASVYENWTDVSGLLMADPRVVPHAMTIPEITYRELRELSYMGASVLHEEAVFPVRSRAIPIHIRNTNKPDDEGTRIVADRTPGPYLITGIAGRAGFTVIFIEKALMNKELGFGRRVLDVFERLGINYEHSPSGIDTLSIVVSDEELGNHLEQVLEDLQGAVHPDRLDVYPGMAMIATVGMGMNRQIGTAARLFNALASSGVNVRMIDQGSSEQNIIIGVEEADLAMGIKAIYNAFTPEDYPGIL